MKNERWMIGFAIVLSVAIHWVGYALWQKSHAVDVPKVSLKEALFSDLPGWKNANVLQSLRTFQVSCRVFLKQDPEQPVGSDSVDLRAKDWYPACHAALSSTEMTHQAAKIFFQTWFRPVEFNNGKPITGLFTGYYLPAMDGRLSKTKKYNTPIYGLPSDLVSARLTDFKSDLPKQTLVGRVAKGRLIPYYTRKMIDQGAISKVAPVLAWVNSSFERLVLEIEGSGVVVLPNGKPLFLGYAGQNGAPYTAIGRVLIDQGVMTRDNASMQRIRAYLEKTPSEMQNVLNKNESFVFFRALNQAGALGSQGTLLTDGYSLAVDRSWVPMGVPLWLNTTRPDRTTNKTHPFKRLMIAQDTGGAIRGPVRGDIYWGAGEKATAIAGKMKDQGRYWLLLPSTYSMPH
jgi:membrane-bound lytic murein transglycosylase A